MGFFRECLLSEGVFTPVNLRPTCIRETYTMSQKKSRPLIQLLSAKQQV